MRIHALLLCGTLMATAAEVPKTIFGTYRKAGAADTLRISRKSGHRIDVNLRLIYAAGHSCNLRENAVWREDRLVVQSEGVRSGEGCLLEMTFDKGEVRLKDEGLRCSKLYCGSRGTLHNAKLAKKR
ncbi:MAG TPA: hypothetical protein VM120_01265 [Bryobacteraceae bacterium]|nr:hypothetical protein [Bryobacteraceae bacterium]